MRLQHKALATMVQTVGWAYTSVKTIPLQDFGAEKGGGGHFLQIVQNMILVRIFSIHKCL